MTDQHPEVYVQPDGTILVWLNPDSDEFIEMTQRQWAMLTIAVDTELCSRRMDQSERHQVEWVTGEPQERDPDWVEHASLLAYERERLEADRQWYVDQGWDTDRGVAMAWPEGHVNGRGVGEPLVIDFEMVDGVAVKVEA